MSDTILVCTECGNGARMGVMCLACDRWQKDCKCKPTLRNTELAMGIKGNG